MREQGVPHVPQFVSVVKEASHPLVGLLSQSPKFPLHVLKIQVPEEQSEAALLCEQTVPQAAQFERVFNCASHPFGASLSQFPHPPLQTPN